MGRLLDAALTAFGLKLTDRERECLENLEKHTDWLPRGYKENSDGTVTTKHGRKIIKEKKWVSGRGALHSNLDKYMNQPRMMEFKKLVKGKIGMKQTSIMLLM